jgi:hypothetical protein
VTALNRVGSPWNFTYDYDQGRLVDLFSVQSTYPDLLRSDGGKANHFLKVLLIETKV